MTKLSEAQREIEILRAIAVNKYADISSGERAGKLMARGLIEWVATGNFGWYLTASGRAILDESANNG